MSEEKSLSLSQVTTLILPPLKRADGKIIVPMKRLEFSMMREAKERHEETRTVGPSNYIDLEIMFSKAFAEMRRGYADIGLALVKAEQELENVKSRIILDEYPEHIKDKPKSLDKTAYLNAFMQRDPEFAKLADYIGTLKAYERLIEGEIKFIEKVVSYMKKQVDLKRMDRFSLPGGGR